VRQYGRQHPQHQPYQSLAEAEAIMRTLLGAAAVFIGIPLGCGGIFGIVEGVGGLGAEPRLGQFLIGMGIVAVLVGSFLCIWGLVKK
jgi:hypothetical protein